MAIERFAVSDYFPHPGEDQETLRRIAQLGVNVQRPAAPIELHPVVEGLPNYVVGVSSAAIANFKLLYGDAINCAVIAPSKFMDGFFAGWFESVARMGLEVVRLESFENNLVVDL